MPLFIALKLTFPEPVTAQNIRKLRKLVKAGPNMYPGAKLVQMPDGSKLIIPPGNSDTAYSRRLAISKRLAVPHPEIHGGIPMIVSAFSSVFSLISFTSLAVSHCVKSI